MIRDYIVESIAHNLVQIHDSWDESDAARDRGEHWLAEEIAKRRRGFEGQNIAYYKIAQQIGFFTGDLSEAANQAFRDLLKEREKRDTLTVKLDALID